MFKIVRLAVVSAVGLALVFLAGRDAGAVQQPAPVLNPAGDVTLMMGMPGNQVLAQKLAKPYEVQDKRDVLMSLFKVRAKGGFGLGAKAPPGMKDGLELAFGELCEDKGPGSAKNALAKGADLGLAAKQTQALADINAFLGPKAAQGMKTPANWKEFNDAMKTGAIELEKAAQAKDAAAIRKAALTINKSCSDCHAKFRDN